MKKKLIITEEQLKKIIKEQEDNRYRREVKVRVWGSTATIMYNGMEINDFSAPNITVTFNIDQEIRNWGIKGIMLYNIQGPKSIEVEVDYYIDDDTQETAMIDLPLDWEHNLEINKQEGQGIVSVGDELDIELVKGEGGKLIAKMEIDEFSL